MYGWNWIPVANTQTNSHTATDAMLLVVPIVEESCRSIVIQFVSHKHLTPRRCRSRSWSGKERLGTSRYIIVRIMRETLICWSWWFFSFQPAKVERKKQNKVQRDTRTHTRIVTIACETVNKLFTVHYRETEIDSSIVETPMLCFRNGKERSAGGLVKFFVNETYQTDPVSVAEGPTHQSIKH